MISSAEWLGRMVRPPGFCADAFLSVMPRVMCVDWWAALRTSPNSSVRSSRSRRVLSLERFALFLLLLLVKYSRVPSSRPLCGGFDLPLVFIDPRLREPIELV